MADMDDLEITRSSVEYTPADGSPGRSWWPLGLAVLVVAVAAAVAFFAMRRPSREAATAPPAAAAIAGEQTPAKDEPIVLPPLRETDPIVRELVRRLSTHPLALTWLATDGLLDNTAVTILNIAEGKAPTTHLRALAPAAKFQVREVRGRLVVDPRGYERYNAYADAVAALDASGVARLYGTLKPRLQEAYENLGRSEGSFDVVLQGAIGELLETPVVEGEIPLRSGVLSYSYADARLQSLSAAQKQLLRMGPRNIALVQGKLREIASAIGLKTSAPGAR